MVTPARVSQRELLGSFEREYRDALGLLVRTRAVERLHDRDPELWKAGEPHASVIRNRLGWLDAPRWLDERIAELTAFAADVREGAFTHVILLGMGGSSLAPEVLHRICHPGPGAPTLDVLDSTDPGAVLHAESASRLDRTFFLVSSKSGKTIETLSQYRYFRARIEAEGLPEPGKRFAAVTDAGSPLDRLGSEEGFRRVFRNPADVGGRYSAITYFGMAPAALLGLNLRGFVEQARAAREESLLTAPDANGALRLGALLGAAALAGRDKLTILTAPALRPLGYWIEQLIAESTGKEGTGIVPVEGEPLGPAHHYGSDRLFLSITHRGEPEPDLERLEAETRRDGAPWVRIELPHADAIAGEFYRWEIATALAAAVMGIDPFDEPNVQESKDNTEEILGGLERTGSILQDPPRAHGEGIEFHAPDPVWARLQSGAPSMPSLEMLLNRFLTLAGPGDYFAILAYLERNAPSEASFALLRRAIRNATHVPVLAGYGPRYLHSIGQLFKGGPPRGLFLELTAADPSDLPIPGRKFSFGQLKAAQALGDFAALGRRERPAIRLHLTRGVEAGLRAVADAVERAVTTMQSV